jgi:hypothetical protein
MSSDFAQSTDSPPPIYPAKPSSGPPLKLLFTVIQLGGWGVCFLCLAIGGISFLTSETAVGQAASGTIMIGGYVFGRIVEKVAQLLLGLLSPKQPTDGE